VEKKSENIFETFFGENKKRNYYIEKIGKGLMDLFRIEESRHGML